MHAARRILRGGWSQKGDGRTWRAVLYVFAFLLLIITYTALYQWGMAAFEGKERSFIHSLQTVVETLTTTGYGEDAPWASVQMNLLMVVMQFSGILAIFLTLPLFVVPWIEQTLQSEVPRTTRKRSGHVVICDYKSSAKTLVQELKARGIDYLIIDPDHEQATGLYKAGTPIIHGDPAEGSMLENAHIKDARAVVTDAPDERTASIVLTAKEAAPDVPVVAMIENPELSQYIRYAGAETVLSPRQLLGVSLANKVATRVTAELGDAISIGDDVQIAEVPVQNNSDLVGQTLEQAGLASPGTASVIGAWLRGDFLSAPAPDTVIDEQTVLLVGGTTPQLEDLTTKARSRTRTYQRGTVLVAGHGEVGATVDAALTNSGITTRVIDSMEGPDIDVVGDATDEETLKEAGIDTANTLIIALGDDSTAIFTTLVARQLSEDIEIIARANQAQNIGKLYRAGADYVLALENVSGRMVARNILGEKVLNPATQIKLIRTATPKLTGKTLAQARIRERTNCTVIGIERDGRVLTDLPSDVTFRDGDEIVVAGTDEAINDFTTQFA